MSFGRPVEPPEVGAFHAGDVTSGSGSSDSCGIGQVAGGQCPAAPGKLRGHADHQGGIRQFEDRLQLPRGQLGRDRLGDGADLPARSEGDEPLDRVGESDRDHVAFPGAPGSHVAGQAIGRRLELRSGQARRTAGDGGPFGMLFGELGQSPAVGDEGHREQRIGQRPRPGVPVRLTEHPPERTRWRLPRPAGGFARLRTDR